MRIAVTGASGLIGKALVRSLRADGHAVVRLVRRPPREPDEAAWDPRRGTVDPAALPGCTAVVHLAGAGIGDRRWTEAYKKEIRDSRVAGTTTLARAIAALDEPPEVLVSASGIGYYGDAGDQVLDERSPAGTGFLPEVCRAWEAATAPAAGAGVRVVLARNGLVVSGGGGAWGRMFPLFRAGLGGRLGDGRQYWSFISLYDEIAAIRHLISTPSLSGPVNMTAPEPLTNREITAAMGRVLHRPTACAVPEFALRLALGELAQDVLGSQRAVPRALAESGFRFTFPEIDDALRAALAATER
ncbi:TIGR01777 family oxidoreductase [Streptomyces bambusae]|uniref:TIGR01777 family oxidoreductase n=1 Tax=Streptomyces bambusae TaxID=1550616 RepID=UPI001CFFEB8B|nr:TIGR01777 family oxidoreductase [Streptomyces bambusae]MCB5170223.1 TIGR01777 family oxidoreductase [Streptomyces bambusae]